MIRERGWLSKYMARRPFIDTSKLSNSCIEDKWWRSEKLQVAGTNCGELEILRRRMTKATTKTPRACTRKTLDPLNT